MKFFKVVLSLLQCVFIHSLASMVCPPGDYATEKGICCNKCSPGFKLVEECHAAGQRSNCTPCPLGQYTDQMNYVFTCMSCKRCLASRNEVQVSACQSNQNTICQCKYGYYKSNIDSVSSQCLKCLPCGPNEMVKQACKSLNILILKNYCCLNSPLLSPSAVPDLIYTVLDLVPVLQVKQLVRTLGVRDIEIEQAEMDHRSCREAHYQMLRVWTERVLRAGEVGQGEMLHWPLMQELLDQLRKMHLEWAADELETNFISQQTPVTEHSTSHASPQLR
uniref:Tumor necrosis factor receptor superfamily, member 1A n=1 Tax=Monopterus albus TaxID=43700 RepID=A0A3Q3KGQ0_MONAL